MGIAKEGRKTHGKLPRRAGNWCQVSCQERLESPWQFAKSARRSLPYNHKPKLAVYQYSVLEM
jgi:hypothetical protein